MTVSKIDQNDAADLAKPADAKVWQTPTLQSFPVVDTNANTVNSGDALNSLDS